MHGIATYPAAQLPSSRAAGNFLVRCCNGYRNAHGRLNGLQAASE